MWSDTNGRGKEPHSSASHQNLLTGSITSNATSANSIVLSAGIALFVSKWNRRWCKEKEMWPASWGIRDFLFIAGTQFPDCRCQILLSWTRRKVKVRSTLSCYPKITWTQDTTKAHSIINWTVTKSVFEGIFLMRRNVSTWRRRVSPSLFVVAFIDLSWCLSTWLSGCCGEGIP